MLEKVEEVFLAVSLDQKLKVHQGYLQNSLTTTSRNSFYKMESSCVSVEIFTYLSFMKKITVLIAQTLHTE